jgi:acetyl-CoA C-acetyltransferase
MRVGKQPKAGLDAAVGRLIVTLGQVGVFVEGVALEIGWRDSKRNLSELIFDTVKCAIDDAGRRLEGIDSVVLAAHDLVDGRSLSSMVTAPAAGAYLRDEIRYGDDGAGAFAAAVTRIEAGECDRTIVAAWGRASEHDVDAVSRTLFDPIFLRPFGLEELHVSAMRAQAWRQQGGNLGDAQAAAQRRQRAAANNPRALRSGGFKSVPSYPLRADDLPLWADMVAAVVLSPEPTGIRLGGLGQSSEPYWIGDRRLEKAPALAQAAARALGEAQCGIDDIDIFEIDGLTLYDEAAALEAIGVAPGGKGLEVLARDGRCNPSGGGAAGYCAPAMGLTRIIEAVLQLQGRAGQNQAGSPRRAIATGSSLAAAQTQTAIILEAA